MYDTERDQSSSSGMGMFAIGALCGAAVGAALGMLYAPRSGKETRSHLTAQGTKLVKTVTEQTESIRDRAGEMYGSASESVNDLMARGREAMAVGKDAFKSAKPNGALKDLG